MILVIFFCDFINRTDLPRQLFCTDHFRFLCLISLQFFRCLFKLNKPFQKFFRFCKLLSLTGPGTFHFFICALCDLKFLFHPVTENSQSVHKISKSCRLTFFNLSPRLLHFFLKFICFRYPDPDSFRLALRL